MRFVTESLGSLLHFKIKKKNLSTRFKLIFLCVFISLFFFIPSILEAREPLTPRFSASAYTGVYTVGQADLMLSLDGDQQHNLYVNPQGAYGSDQQWYGDLGLGYRWIKNDAAILGWYLFAGHNRVQNSSGFWITNPGVEVMGSRWDARINAYIPVAGRSNELKLEEFNIVNTPVFTGHTEVINSTFNVENTIQQVGNGADARVGYQFFQQVPLKGYVGTYFFAIPNTNNITGGAAGLEYWFDENIRVFANYSYDNYQHSKVVGGLGISFGGVRRHHADPSLSERLTDPVDRYLANLGHGSGIPSKTLLYGMGRGSSTQLISDSIAFFSQTGTPNNGGTGLTLADCTFENPCGPTDFSQTGVNTLNSLLPNTMMFFNGGNYILGINPLQLNNGQSVSSRTTDYSAPATGNDRSVFGGGFSLSGNNQLENIVLIPLLGGVPDTGVTATGLNNQIIGSTIGDLSNFYSTGVDAAGGNLLIEETDIFSNSVAVSSSNANVQIQNSVLNVDNTLGGTANGIFAENNSNISLIDSIILVAGATPTINVGINALNSTINVIQSDIDVNNANVIDGNATVLQNSGGQISIAESELNVEADNGRITTGNPVTFVGTVCTVNGGDVDCATS